MDPAKVDDMTQRQHSNVCIIPGEKKYVLLEFKLQNVLELLHVICCLASLPVQGER